MHLSWPYLALFLWHAGGVRNHRKARVAVHELTSESNPTEELFLQQIRLFCLGYVEMH